MLEELCLEFWGKTRQNHLKLQVRRAEAHKFSKLQTLYVCTHNDTYAYMFVYVNV